MVNYDSKIMKVINKESLSKMLRTIPLESTNDSLDDLNLPRLLQKYISSLLSLYQTKILS